MIENNKDYLIFQEIKNAPEWEDLPELEKEKVKKLIKRIIMEI